MIAIIDYGAGNMHSIEKALQHVGAEVQVTDSPAGVQAAEAVVLPGVGSGGAAMARMTERGLDEAIRQALLNREVLQGDGLQADPVHAPFAHRSHADREVAGNLGIGAPSRDAL